MAWVGFYQTFNSLKIYGSSKKMDIELAKTFLEIVNCGSFITAGEKLHITQAVIIARVQKLERSLNCKLFLRTSTRTRLTTEGASFFEYANQLIKTWNAAVRDLPLPRHVHKVLHIGGEVSSYHPHLEIGFTK